MATHPGMIEDGDVLAPYVPRPVIDWIEHYPELRHRVIDGTVVFVDISGFTKLSEGLAKHGKIGAEELAATIGECFVHLLDMAYSNGGRLLKFGGDALLLLFTGGDHEARACRAAFEMRATLRAVGRLTVLGQQVTLRMSVGIHSGQFDMFLVGTTHRELVVTGTAASVTVAMEGAASAGEILVSDQTAAALRASDLGPERKGGRLLRRAPALEGVAATPRDPVPAGVDLTRCIPVAILGSIRGASHEPEHRRVTVAFIHFDGTDALLESAGPDVVSDDLDLLISDAQDAADRQGITFLGTDIDHDGGKVILVAGAPSTTGDDEHHMLLAIRQILDRDRHPALRVGLHRGPVFAGDIGPPYRRTFTVMGDTVNLAARLMAKAAPGQILATPEVMSRSRSDFKTAAVAPFFVKGKAKPVEAVDVGDRVGARAVDPGADFPLVGRHDEMKIWHALVDSVRGGSGAVVELVGEPGVGKSRLVEEFRSNAQGMALLRASCEYYESSRPYGALRSLVRKLLHLDGAKTDEVLGVELIDALAALSPTLVPWTPLVAAVVDLDVPDTPETAELEPEFRGLRLGESMVEILSCLLRRPTLLVIEDTHWMDEASAELLRHVAAAADTHPWLLCFTRRDVESGFVAPDHSLTRLRLEPLAATEAATFVEMASDNAPLAPHEVAALSERSGGNPLFLRELVAAARDADGIDSLPDSIEAVIAARIDRLAADDRHFLRQVSVLGRTAPIDLVEVVLDIPDEADTIWQRLREFLVDDEAGNLVFRHALLRDGAYEGLSYRRRRTLHAQVADALRGGGGRDPEDQSELLSLHYFYAQRYREAWTYSLVAADRARSVYANVEAAGFLERALSAARHLPELTARELSEVREALGDTRRRAGGYRRAVDEYRAARRLVDEDVLAQARLMLKISQVQGWFDRFSDALRWITRALQRLEGSQGAEAQRQRAQLLAWYGRFCQEEGRHARAIKWCRQAVAVAEAADEKEALANALWVLDWAQMDLGKLEEPANWRRALALFEEIGDLHGQGTALNSLGIFAYFRGEWDQALDLYGRAQQKAHRSGNAVQLAAYENNVAEIMLDQGRIDEAERLFASALRTYRAGGFRSGAAHQNCNLARVAACRGHYDEAVRLFELSRHEAEAIGGHVELLETGARLSECLLLAGDTEGARTLAQNELERARALGGVAPQTPLLHRVCGVAAARDGDQGAARHLLEQSLQAARLRHADYEMALTMRVMAALHFDDNGRAPEQVGQDGNRILDALGVVWVPDLLAPRGRDLVTT